MQFNISIYIPGATSVHRLDARVKLVLLLAYSITLFFIHTWAGLLICIAACLAATILTRVSFGRMFSLLVPVYVILAFTLAFNSFALDVGHVATIYGMGDVSAGVLTGAAPVPLFGTFGFVPEGFARGCFYALRIVFLVLASFIVCFTTTSNDLTDALNDFLKPLRAFRVPTQDIAMMVSIALRFIPVTAEEFGQVRAAQWARGAAFSDGSVIERLRAWQTVLIPLFVGLFRRADNLAIAMESRCYGMGDTRTELNPRRLSGSSVAVLGIGLAACVALGALL
ncbi:energy-coupling factor transporter transmembrane component T family protein [Raoultibacter massiliensis]|uniref:energy-coupling factor transporter transmembrane component T family protein n=1 Tax=Raoultibacter massiliensis TaxID=1852371 RepID=UPI003A931BFE